MSAAAETLALPRPATVPAARGFVTAAFALALVGFLLQLAVVSPVSRDPYERPLRQAAYIAAATLLGVLASRIGYARAIRWSRPLLWATWALLGLLLLPGMPRQYGAARWLDLGPIHLQPSELAKLTMILFLTGFAVRRGPKLGSFREGALPALLYVGVTAALVRAEPDLGQTLFLVALSGAVLLANGLKLKHCVPIVFVGAALLVIHALRGDAGGGSYVGDRVRGFLEGSHYQVQQGLGFFGLGGWDGTGLDDRRAHLFVPMIHNDFVLVAVGEAAGFAGSALVVGLFAWLLIQGVRVALQAPDRAGASVAFGVSTMIALQAAVNVAVVTASVPPKGISLPFLSFGGSSLLVLGIAAGLLHSTGTHPAGVAAAAAPPGGVKPLTTELGSAA